MHDWQSLSHVRWDCKYHVVIVPKYRKKVIYGELRRQVGPILRRLCQQRGITLLEGHAMSNRFIFPLTFLRRGKIKLLYSNLQKESYTTLVFWATGYYCVSTVGLDEETIRQYIREQELLESGQGELDLK